MKKARNCTSKMTEAGFPIRTYIIKKQLNHLPTHLYEASCVSLAHFASIFLTLATMAAVKLVLSVHDASFSNEIMLVNGTIASLFPSMKQ
jgi:hypothetical protein